MFFRLIHKLKKIFYFLLHKSKVIRLIIFTYNSFHFMSREYGFTSVIGLGLVKDASSPAPELSDLLHQVIPVRSLGGLLLQLLKFLTFGTAYS